MTKMAATLFYVKKPFKYLLLGTSGEISDETWYALSGTQRHYSLFK